MGANRDGAFVYGSARLSYKYVEFRRLPWCAFRKLPVESGSLVCPLQAAFLLGGFSFDSLVSHVEGR
jgi:hypothetical protein